MNTDAFPLNYNGRVYNTFAAFCRGEGLPYSRTHARMKAGRPMHEWFVDRPLGRRNSALDTGDYPSVKAMADACGVSYGTVMFLGDLLQNAKKAIGYDGFDDADQIAETGLDKQALVRIRATGPDHGALRDGKAARPRRRRSSWD